jgi:predicted dinucleotide-binding enzyme
VSSRRTGSFRFPSSGAEELQKTLPRARGVKAFNTVVAQHLDTGRVGRTPVCAFIAQDLGFEPVDAGPLKKARLLEPLAYLNIQLGYVLGLGTGIGFKLAKA